MVHMAIREQEKMPVHFKRQVQIRALLFDKTPIEIPVEYSDNSKIFLVENAAKLQEKSRINEYAIELEEGN